MNEICLTTLPRLHLMDNVHIADYSDYLFRDISVIETSVV
jgi:hypothetical protein